MRGLGESVNPGKPSLLNPGWLAGLLAVVLLAALMPSGESLWIDETSTVRFAGQATLSDLAGLFRAERGSEVQMPLGMLAFWGWQKLAGSSEWALRALNIGWTLLAAWALFLTGKRLRLPLLPLWFIVQPFLWFYANEARPYVMQIAGSAWLLYGMITAVQTRASGSSWAASFLLGALLLAGASLLGAVPLFSAIVLTGGGLLLLRARPSRSALLILGLGVLLLAPLGLYYLHTLKQGAGGSKIWTVGGVNAAFAGYELTGFSGLGPGRLEIREVARSGTAALLGVLKPFGPGLAALAFLYAVLGVRLKNVFPPARSPAIALTLLHAGLTVALLAGAALLVKFPFWGRHLAPALPCVAVLAAWCADRFVRDYSGSPLARLVPALLVALLLASSLSLRFSERHRKDDYRQAVRLANDALRAGLQIGWAADEVTARYYQAPFDAPRGPGRLYALHAAQPGLFEADLAGPAPDLVILSKHDLFDPQGRLEAWLRDHRYEPHARLHGFVVWAKPTQPPQ